MNWSAATAALVPAGRGHVDVVGPRRLGRGDRGDLGVGDHGEAGGRHGAEEDLGGPGEARSR